MRKIVLTGGPGAGKSIIAGEIVRRMSGRFILVPEAATQVYTMLGSRWDKLNLDDKLEAQRQIYRLQLDQEARIAEAHPDKSLLLDRGTVDGAAYWPSGPDEYWRDLCTDFPTELARYHTVIWLETAAAIGMYDGDASNTVRFEGPTAAIESGAALLKLWSAHPNLHRVKARPVLEEKIAAVLKLL